MRLSSTRWLLARAFLALATIAGFIGTATASACPNEASPGFRSYLPDCRAYEMVTPPYKEGGYGLQTDEASADGSQLLVASLGNLLGPGGTLPEGTGPLTHNYRLARTGSGWEPTSVEGPFSSFTDVEVQALSPDFSSSFWFASRPGESSDDAYVDQPDGLTLIGPGSPPGALESSLHFAGGSADLHHALFLVHSARIGLEEEHLWPGDTTHPERRPSIYEYAGPGHEEPELVGVGNQTSVAEAARTQGVAHLNEAAKLISDCGTLLGSLPEGDAYNAVSASGATVFFSSEACAGGPAVNELYARIDGEQTVPISEPETTVPGRVCTGDCALAESVPANRSPGLFAGASLDGSRVFFTTSQPLIDTDTDSGSDLYAADIREGVVTGLADVSRGGSGDPTPGAGAGVLGVARVSEDGSHVYFLATGVLTGANREGAAPHAGEPNLYVAVRECPGGSTACASPAERTSFIATLSAADAGDWNPIDRRRPVQATPDGRFFLFQAADALTSDQHGHAGAAQLFEYDAPAETLTRVSRGQDGFGDDGNSAIYQATIPTQNYELDRPDGRFAGLAMSTDGSRIFFTSSDALTPQALLGYPNVYEYQDGQVGLISDGHDVTETVEGSATRLIGTDETGDDVFFTTADQLLPRDTDTWLDVYDARIDGGFPLLASPPKCAGDACQGAAAQPPTLAMPAPPVAQPPPAPTSSTRPPPRPLTRAQKLARALRLCLRRRRAARRACQLHARKLYGSGR